MDCPRCGVEISTGTTHCPQCGATTTYVLTELPEVPLQVLLARTLPAGLVLKDTYQIQRLVAEGGMGVVYEAWDRALDRRVAIKALHANLLGNRGIRRRFLREARLMRSWSHPNVVAVHDLIDADEVLAIVLEFVEGTTLKEEIARWQGRMPLSTVREVAEGMCAALEHAHARGIVHRDLKPGNVLLERHGGRLVARVIDFGIAKVLEGTTYTVTGALLGTTRYMSPEQVSTPDQVGPAADIYALGVNLYEMACGSPPFFHENHFNVMMAHVNQVPEPPSARRPGLPAQLDALVLECLAKDPAARPSSAALVLARLSELVPAEATGSTRPVPRVEADPVDGDLVLVPEGTFQMGPTRREVWLDGFYVQRHPVTNAAFARFLDVTGYVPTHDAEHRFVAHFVEGRPRRAVLQHPVVLVSLEDARAYAVWAGLRLLSEAEWEKAARGTDGRRYPWGRTPPDANLAHFGLREGGPAAVGSHTAGASPYGIEDLAGNVWEWCDEVADDDFYSNGPSRNPRRPVGPSDLRAVVRGGAWMFDAHALRTTARASFDPTYRMDVVGFRCGRGLSATG